MSTSATLSHCSVDRSSAKKGPQRRGHGLEQQEDRGFDGPQPWQGVGDEEPTRHLRAEGKGDDPAVRRPLPAELKLPMFSEY